MLRKLGCINLNTIYIFAEKAFLQHTHICVIAQLFVKLGDRLLRYCVEEDKESDFFGGLVDTPSVKVSSRTPSTSAVEKLTWMRIKLQTKEKEEKKTFSRFIIFLNLNSVSSKTDKSKEQRRKGLELKCPFSTVFFQVRICRGKLWVILQCYVSS